MALKIFEYESFVILLKWYALFVYKIKWKKLSYCQPSNIFCEGWKGSFPMKDIINSSFKKNLREKAKAGKRRYGVKVAAKKE